MSLDQTITDKIITVTNAFEEKTFDETKTQLIFLINELIKTDFQALAQLLYRIDVDEKKLKNLLRQYEGADAAPIISDLIIKRQIEKIETKKQFGNNKNTGADERW